MFPDVELVRSVQQELDKVIEEGVINTIKLFCINRCLSKLQIDFLDDLSHLIDLQGKIFGVSAKLSRLPLMQRNMIKTFNNSKKRF